ncbi:hypothetical protein [Amycolatopsis sulphurea]|uniref:hypothetical protein n=1 Tax=Amycolatopsis sulphurea TaxID=76022 RepID=UPI0014738553|nr:hypothetical protein [Amycolatopsis sulphurea]
MNDMKLLVTAVLEHAPAGRLAGVRRLVAGFRLDTKARSVSGEVPGGLRDGVVAPACGEVNDGMPREVPIRWCAASRLSRGAGGFAPIPDTEVAGLSSRGRSVVLVGTGPGIDVG